MTAPTPASARTTPLGQKIDNGYAVFICFAADPDVSFWEVSVKPPGVDGGDAIPVSTQFNVDVETMRARVLKKITDGGAKVQYDARMLNEALAIVNVETTVTIIFPNGDKYAFYGYLKSFIPGEMSHGAKPDADVVIVATNVDPATGAEEKPVFTPASGT